MEYSAGLDASMRDERLLVNRDGVVMPRPRSRPRQPISRRRFEGTSLSARPVRVGPDCCVLYHGLAQFGLLVVCVESRQAYEVASDPQNRPRRCASLAHRAALMAIW
jgi:transposase